MSNHPNQPIEYVGNVIRFKKNPIVEYLLDNGGIDMNHLAIAKYTEGWTDEDQAQFAQLIGYSVSGWGDLSYVSSQRATTQDRRAEKLYNERMGDG